MRPERPNTFARAYRVVLSVEVPPPAELADVNPKAEKANVGLEAMGALTAKGARVLGVAVYGEGARGVPDWSLDPTTGEVRTRED